MPLWPGLTEQVLYSAVLLVEIAGQPPQLRHEGLGLVAFLVGQQFAGPGPSKLRQRAHLDLRALARASGHRFKHRVP